MRIIIIALVYTHSNKDTSDRAHYDIQNIIKLFHLVLRIKIVCSSLVIKYNINLDYFAPVMYIQNESTNGNKPSIDSSKILGNLIYRKTFTHSLRPVITPRRYRCCIFLTPCFFKGIQRLMCHFFRRRLVNSL